MKISVEVNNVQKKPVQTAGLDDLVRIIWERECRNSCEIRIVLTDDHRTLELNQTYLKKDTLTDVIAFPLEETEELFEGEIYINIDQIIRNAVAFDVSETDELKRIVAHGTLHFAGYDDKTVAAKLEMTKLEDTYLAKFAGQKKQCE